MNSLVPSAVENPGPIIGAGRGTIRSSASVLPDMSDAIKGWFSPIEMTAITTTIVDGEAKEGRRTIQSAGVLQPMKGRQLLLKPEGHRAYRWFVFYADVGVRLKPDDIVTLRGVVYRVMSPWDWSDARFMKYELVEGTQLRAT